MFRGPPGEYSVGIYHRCQGGAFGSVFSAATELAYWWADPAGHVRVVGWVNDELERAKISIAISERLGHPGDVVRSLQDDQGESVL